MLHCSGTLLICNRQCYCGRMVPQNLPHMCMYTEWFHQRMMRHWHTDELENKPLSIIYLAINYWGWYHRGFRARHWVLINWPRLCSSGARSPQATNIWSRATEKEKQSPVRALRFRLLWKPETKRANVLERNRTKWKKLPRASALPLARKTKALIAQCNSIFCVIYIRCTSSLFRFVGFTSGSLIWYMAQLSCSLNDAIKRATDCN